jgi:colanic acid biosynthesis glycosyl transferase WcaI
VAVLYHYMHPDDVVSARHFDGLCEGLAERGWDVTAMPSNRGCRDESRRYPLKEEWGKVSFRRVWRPAMAQATTIGRLTNAAWMIGAWSVLAARGGPAAFDAVIVGTDPVMSVVVAPVISRLRREMRVAHWAYDLYPEAPIADGMLDEGSLVARTFAAVARAGYRSCDLIADLGPCMRDRLRAYEHGARETTLVPWALSEPSAPVAPDPRVRASLFGDAALGVLYSGNYGRAHAHEPILELARSMRSTAGPRVHFCFAVRGNRAAELRAAVKPQDVNVSFAGFCEESELEKRLGAADVHLATLRPEWSGVVVPSKFFGSLAAGRPVLYAGPERSSIARWIEEHRCGWSLTEDTRDEVAAALRTLAEDRAALEAMTTRCHAVYHENFSRLRTLDRWDRELRKLLPGAWSDRSAGDSVGG